MADHRVLELVQAGAAGCVVVGDDWETQIVAAIASVASGYSWLSPELLQRLVQVDRDVTPHGYLTPREFEVLTLIGKGLENGQIAKALSISKYTVQNHVAAIYDKLGLPDRSHAILYAIRHGLAGFSNHQSPTEK